MGGFCHTDHGGREWWQGFRPRIHSALGTSGKSNTGFRPLRQPLIGNGPAASAFRRREMISRYIAQSSNPRQPMKVTSAVHFPVLCAWGDHHESPPPASLAQLV